MIVINSNTRQFSIPGADLVFGVTADSGSEIKHFQCPRHVGNGLDVASSFVRINYRNANGETDFYLVEDITVDGDNVKFSWELSPKVTAYKGQVKFVMCVVGPDLKVKWHTTLGSGQIHEGLEPEQSHIEDATADVVAQLVAMVEAQTGAVETVGTKWVADVNSEGATQVAAVKTAAQTAQAASVAEIEAKGVNTRESIPEDYTALSEAVDDLVRGRACAIVCEISGETAVVNDSSNLPMQSLCIFGRSTQDGIPSPDAPVEIKSVENPVVTVYGKNLCPMSAFSTMTQNGQPNTYDASTHKITMGADTAPGNFTGRYCRPLGSEFVIGTVYTVSFDIKGTPGKIVACGWDWNRTTITLTDTFTRYKSVKVAERVDEVLSFYSIATKSGGLSSGEYMQFTNVQIECGETATEYEEYKIAQTIPTTHTLPGIPVTSGGNYTDESGQQWLCDEIDLERGVCVKRIGEIVFDGTQTYHINAYQQMQGFTVFGCSQFGASYSGAPVLCDKLTYKPWGYWNLASGTNFICYETSAFFMYLEDKSITTVEAFREYLVNNPITAKYILATPIETPLSETEIAAYRALHSNYPNTTVLNDAGAHMVVKYAADTKLYIDNKIAALVGG